MNTGSPSYSLNKADIIAVGWSLLALILATAFVFALQLLPDVSFGSYTPLVVLVLTPLLHAGISWVKANDTNLPDKNLIDALPGKTGSTQG